MKRPHRALAAFLACLALCTIFPARAPASEPVKSEAPKVADAAARIVEPLREIGRVKAHSPFCNAFVAGARPGVDSALRFEVRLQRTMSDLRGVDFSNLLAKERTLRKVEADLNALADLAGAGRDELHRLHDLAAESDDATHDSLVAFADALDGAKGHQITLARKLSSLYGRLAEQDVYSFGTTPADDRSSGFARGRAASPNGDWLETNEDVERYERGQALFEANPDDRVVGADLERAGVAGRLTMSLNAC